MVAVSLNWEELLGREIHPFLPSTALPSLQDKRVLVTGAGGSIGSALVRRLAGLETQKIILLEASEAALYRVDRSIGASHASVLANVCDSSGLDEIFLRHKPQIVFHAAAVKHVPLMERNPFAAVQTNALGTLYVAQAAARHGAQTLVLLSTDKAVEPISIMGVSKRIAELVVVAMAPDFRRAIALRLGNVLASDGSVVPLFLEQIAAGGPVTVTHPEASRYFITIDEAVAYLLTALVLPEGNNIVVPELGIPIRIVDLARKLIAAHGRSASNSPQIAFTRLRPGDKQIESLLAASETLQQARFGSLRPIHSAGIERKAFWPRMAEIEAAVAGRDLRRLLNGVTQLVPEYRPSEVLLEAHPEISLGGRV